jgi:hypothetical protein
VDTAVIFQQRMQLERLNEWVEEEIYYSVQHSLLQFYKLNECITD